MSGQLQLEVENLRVGMYVSELDRPWLDTPFLLQGFYIQDESDIDLIKKYCSYVYIKPDSKTRRNHANNVVQRTATSSNSKHRNGRKRKARNTPIHKFFYVSRNLLRKKKQEQPLESLVDPIYQKTIRVDIAASESQKKNIFKNINDFNAELSTAKDILSSASVTFQNVLHKITKNNEIDVEEVNNIIQPLTESIKRNHETMTWLSLMKSKDNYVYQHAISTSVWAILIGKKMGMNTDDLNNLGVGAMLMDLGKIRIPQELLNKTEKLSSAELAVLKNHVSLSLDLVKKNKTLDKKVIDMIASHHERHNGAGYPNGLAGKSIPLFGRIGGIVDCFDALISPRPYSSAISTYECFRILNRGANIDFQQELLEEFIKAIGFFPTGTLVELSNGEVGVIVCQNEKWRLRPDVLVILDSDKQELEEGRLISLNMFAENDEDKVTIVRGLEPDAYGLSPRHLEVM